MRIPLFTLAFAAVATASPFPQAVPAITSIPIPLPTPSGANSTTSRPTKTRWHNPHKEPTPSFGLPCNCAKPIVPIDLLSPAEKCEFEWAFAMGCYYRAQGGCPSPVMNCGTPKETGA